MVQSCLLCRHCVSSSESEEIRFAQQHCWEKDGTAPEKGSCARVSLDIHHLEKNRYFLYRMVCSRDGVAHVYDALGMLMPTAIHAALQHADAQHLEELQFGIRQLTQKGALPR